MKAKILVALALCSALPMMSRAEEIPANLMTVAPISADDCPTYISLFHESAKNKQYADAIEPWMQVLLTCPNGSQNIYVDGDKIVEWKLSKLQAGTEEYNQWRQLLLTLHDKRIEYYGTSTKYPAAYILGEKGVDYCTYFTEDATRGAAYPWLKESVEKMGIRSKISVIEKLADVSLALYKAEPAANAEQYIADYQICSELYGQMAADPANKNAAAAQGRKDNLDQAFAASGAANCDKLDELYQQTVAANKQNLELLNKVMALYRRVGCVESDVYFAAAEAAHTLNPTAESAAGCAAMCKKKEDWKGAVEYYDQAVEYAEDNNDKAEYLYRAAMVLFQNLNSFSQSRQYLRRSLEMDPNQGRCYLLMGFLYASSQPYSSAEYGAKASILNKTVFWAAVDKFNKAKQVDPSLTEEANKQIAKYSRYYPTKEERFDLPAEFSGSTFTVGGWIGETTSIR